MPFLTGVKRDVGGWCDYGSGQFYSRGKLLLTGEYAVLCGARALALPVSRGQVLKWKNTGDGTVLEWTTKVKGKKSFNAVFEGANYLLASTSDIRMAVFLRKILLKAKKFSSDGPVYGKVYSVVDFDLQWGLGSSSSLISNIAYLFDVNPFFLHFAVSNGSGYDIACARSDSPVLYRLTYQTNRYFTKERPGRSVSFEVPVYREVDFNPPFRDNLFFAWTGKKKDSAKSVDNFLARNNVNISSVDEISKITEEVINVHDIGDFNRLLKEHDRIISRVTDQQPVSKSMFSDFPGYVKSMGAWGGDFVMISWGGEPSELLDLLKPKGINVVFPYGKLINLSHG